MTEGNLNNLQAFCVVARLRNFRRAAAELNVSPSALSHTLRKLEAQLEVRLLNRTTRSVAPTDAGLALYERLNPALLDIAGAIDEINAYRQSPLGTLRINAPRSAVELVLAPLAERFLRDNPGMRLELVAENRLVDIVAEGFDAGVRFGERLAQDMVAVPLGPPLRFVVVASPTYLATYGRPITPRDLAGHQCIRQRFASGGYLQWYFSKEGESMEVDPPGRLAISEIGLAPDLARAGLGLAFVYADHAAPGLADGSLVSVLDDWRPAETGYFLYYPSRRLVTTGLRAFLELAREAFPGNRPFRPDALPTPSAN